MMTLFSRLSLLALLCLIQFAYGSSRLVRSTGNTVRFEITLTWEDWAPAGSARKMILTNGQFPGPSLQLKQGDDVEFLVTNLLPVSTTVHFHGIHQTDTPWSDGVPGLSQRPIEPGQQFLYKWKALQYGSYFYHAHTRGQIEDGLYGAIHIIPDDSVARPFELITSNPIELQAMQAAEEDSTPVIISDWRQLTSEQIWKVEEASGRDAFCVNALLINGKGSVTCMGRDAINQFTSAAQTQVLNGSKLTDMACLPPSVQIAQGGFPYNASALPPTVFSGCRPSQGPREVFKVDPIAGYVSYDIINAAGVTVPVFSIDEHPMYVYAIDGQYIEPLLVDAVAIANGARYSVMAKLDKPPGDYTIRVANNGVNQILNTTAVMSYNTLIKTKTTPSVPSININGANATADAVILDETKVVPYPVEAPALDVAQTSILRIGHYHASYRWTMGNSSFPLALEEAQPLLFNRSAARNDLTIRTRNGTWIDLIFSVDTPLQPPHPIHKHSNKFFVIGQGDGLWNYSSVAEAMKHIPQNFNLVNPQIRDTFITPPAATGPTWLALRYQVVNPGAFLLHCHVQVHQSGGMALAMLDGVDEWPEIPEEYRLAASGV